MWDFLETRRFRWQDQRFRIQKNVHETYLTKHGYYILYAPGHRAVRMTAYMVDEQPTLRMWVSSSETKVSYG